MTADDLIGQLKLHAGGTTRGIHALAAPVTEAPAVVTRDRRGRVPSATPVAARALAPTSGVEKAGAEKEGEASLTVQFETGSDRLTPAAVKVLDTLGKALSSSALAGNNFRIVGHTDSVGRPEANQVLSERRAEAVVAYIAAHYNVDRSRLTALGRGQSEPLVPTAEGVPAPQNRRVQVINLGV